MKKKLILVVLIVFVSLAIFSCKTTNAVWYTDFEAAKEVATTENKDMLIVFSGKTFESASDILFSEVLETSAFNKATNKNFVLLSMDVINSVEGLSEEEIESYREAVELAYSLEIQFIPSICIVSTDGKIIETFPYDENVTKKEVLGDVKGVAKQIEKNASLEEKIEKSNGLKKAKAIAELYENNKSDASAMIPYIDTFLENDPDNETGLRGTFMRFQTMLLAAEAVQTGDLDGAVALFLELTKAEYSTPEDVQIAYYYAAYYESYGGQYITDNVLGYLQAAIEVDPESEVGQVCKEIIDEYNNTVSYDYSDLYGDYEE